MIIIADLRPFVYDRDKGKDRAAWLSVVYNQAAFTQRASPICVVATIWNCFIVAVVLILYRFGINIVIDDIIRDQYLSF